MALQLWLRTRFLGDFDDDPFILSELSSVELRRRVRPHLYHARYNLAIALSHLGELVGDVECFHLAAEQFSILLQSDPEDCQGWEEWGGMLLQQAILMNEPARPAHARALRRRRATPCHAVALAPQQHYIL